MFTLNNFVEMIGRLYSFEEEIFELGAGSKRQD
jgi:hypothetical protein